MNWPIIIAFVGAILSAVGAIWLSIKQAEESDAYATKVDNYAKKQAENDNEVKNLQKQLIEKAEVQNQKTEQIAKLNAELAESQKEIAKLTVETANNVTGGDGYCYVNITPDIPGKALADITNDSKYPLYDIEVQINPWLVINTFYVEESDAKAYGEATNFSERYNFKVGTLASMKSQLVTNRVLGLVPFDYSKKSFFTINFTARNGEWTQIWELSIDEKSNPISSHIIYKTVVEKQILKRVILKKSIHSKAKNSVLNFLILEQKLSMQ